MKKKGTVLFIPHGGGPLPILGDPRHQELIKFLEKIKTRINKPSSIIIVSAHWEEEEVKITSGEKPSLIYDYSGFPKETYKIIKNAVEALIAGIINMHRFIGFKKIIALLLIPQVLILYYLKNNPRIVEEYYSEYIYQYIFKYYSMLFSGFSIAIGDLIFFLAFISFVIYFIFFFRFKKNDFVNIIAVISIIIFLFYSLWGLNYFKTPLISKLNISEVNYESLEKTLTELINDVNQIHLSLGDENITINDLEFDKEKVISELKLNNVNKFNKIPTTKFVKKSILPELYLYQGVSGYINPFTLSYISFFLY